MAIEFLQKEDTGLLVIDVQKRLFPHIENRDEMLDKILKAIRGFQLMNMPIVVTEQIPEKMWETVDPIASVLGDNFKPIPKTSFSCAKEAAFNQVLQSIPVKNWVLVGMEAHVCILQTAKDMARNNQSVTVLNDAISSRSIFDYSTAIAEMLRLEGIRISSVETVLFELLGNCQVPEFKAVTMLLK